MTLSKEKKNKTSVGRKVIRFPCREGQCMRFSSINELIFRSFFHSQRGDKNQCSHIWREISKPADPWGPQCRISATWQRIGALTSQSFVFAVVRVSCRLMSACPFQFSLQPYSVESWWFYLKKIQTAGNFFY